VQVGESRYWVCRQERLFGRGPLFGGYAQFGTGEALVLQVSADFTLGPEKVEAPLGPF
jgi:hypothetical protein